MFNLRFFTFHKDYLVISIDMKCSEDSPPRLFNPNT